MSHERLAGGAVHYAADCRRRVSHGPRVIVTAKARSGVPSHGAPLRGRQLSARIISFFSCDRHNGQPKNLKTHLEIERRIPTM
jgi:hypothetical protein